MWKIILIVVCGIELPERLHHRWEIKFMVTLRHWNCIYFFIDRQMIYRLCKSINWVGFFKLQIWRCKSNATKIVKKRFCCFDLRDFLSKLARKKFRTYFIIIFKYFMCSVNVFFLWLPQMINWEFYIMNLYWHIYKNLICFYWTKLRYSFFINTCFLFLW